MTDELDWKSAALLMAADIGRITEALGMDPDDGGAAPILAELDRLRQQIAERENAHAVLTESDHTGAVSVYTGMCSDGVERQFVRRDQLAERGEPVAWYVTHGGDVHVFTNYKEAKHERDEYEAYERSIGEPVEHQEPTPLYEAAPPAQSAVPGKCPDCGRRYGDHEDCIPF